MSSKQQPPIDIQQDLNYQHHVWRIQRIGWLVLGVILVAGLLGSFGSGIFDTTIAKGEHITVEYARFDRRLSPSTMKIQLNSADDPVLVIDQSLTESIEIQQIIPEPASVASRDRNIYYYFDHQSRNNQLSISLDYQPNSVGVVSGSIGTNNNKEMSIQFFVFP